MVSPASLNDAVRITNNTRLRSVPGLPASERPEASAVPDGHPGQVGLECKRARLSKGVSGMFEPVV